MSRWCIFIVGGVMEFCLDIMSLILMITFGESDIRLAIINLKEQFNRLTYLCFSVNDSPIGDQL